MQVLIKKTLYEEHQAINKEDMDLYTITDDEDEIIGLIKQAPVRKMVSQNPHRSFDGVTEV